MNKTKFNILFSTVLILMACNSNSQYRQEQFSKDSLQLVEQQKLDSLNLAKERALAKKAYAGSKFGMSIKEVSKLPHFKDWYMNPGDKDICYEQLEIIGNCHYKVKIHFDNDILYMVEFSSSKYKSATYLETDVAKDVENFKEVISSTYGEPTTSISMPSVLDLKPNQMSVVYLWVVSSKVIKISVMEKYDGAEYSMFALIKDTDLEAVVNQKIEKLEKEEKANAPVLF